MGCLNLGAPKIVKRPAIAAMETLTKVKNVML